MHEFDQNTPPSKRHDKNPFTQTKALPEILCLPVQYWSLSNYTRLKNNEWDNYEIMRLLRALQWWKHDKSFGTINCGMIIFLQYQTERNNLATILFKLCSEIGYCVLSSFG